jgi:hypothetical protein
MKKDDVWGTRRWIILKWILNKACLRGLDSSGSGYVSYKRRGDVLRS